MICYLRPKRGWNIFESLKSWHITGSAKEKLVNLSINQSKLTFWNRLHTKIAFVCRLLTQTTLWRPNHPILTSNVKAIVKAITKFKGIFYLSWEVLTTRESTLGLTGWNFSYSIYMQTTRQGKVRIFISKTAEWIILGSLQVIQFQGISLCKQLNYLQVVRGWL